MIWSLKSYLLRRRLLGLALGFALVALLFAAACTGDEEEAAAPTSTPALTPEAPPAPPQTATPPLVGGFYKGQAVTYLLTDISSEPDAKALSDATGYPVTFVASLGDVPEGSLAKLYLFMNGVSGPNPFGFQANVLDSVPGDPGYSPLWRVYAAKWSDTATPRELKSEAEIVAAQQAGELTVEKTPLVKNSPVVR